jgi:hypothetical protein
VVTKIVSQEKLEHQVKEFGGLVDRPVLRSDEVLQVDD